MYIQVYKYKAEMSSETTAEISSETTADFSESLKFYNKLKINIQKCLLVMKKL